MAGTKQEPLLDTGEEKNLTCKQKYKAKFKELTCKKKTAVVCGCSFCVCFVIAWIIQGIMFYYATLGCGPRMLAKYNYVGGEPGELGTSKTNLVPRISLITEKTPRWFSRGFDDIPSNENSGPAGSATGVWNMYWGPIFRTFVYQDNSQKSEATIYARRNLLRIGSSYSIFRCDEMGSSMNTQHTCKFERKTVNGNEQKICVDKHEHYFDRVIISEGSFWLRNRFRAFWHMNQGSSFKVYMDGTLVAIAEEVLTDTQSITFRSESGDKVLASGLLIDRNYHNEQKDEWLVKTPVDSSLPFYVPTATTLIMAFDAIARQTKTERKAYMNKHPGGNGGNPGNPNFLEVPLSPVNETAFEMDAQQLDNAASHSLQEGSSYAQKESVKAVENLKNTAPEVAQDSVKITDDLKSKALLGGKEINNVMVPTVEKVLRKAETDEEAGQKEEHI